MGWRIDYFLLSDKFNLESINKIDINNEIFGSDHTPIEIVLDLDKI